MTPSIAALARALVLVAGRVRQPPARTAQAGDPRQLLLF
jgi:hypothetical protein